MSIPKPLELARHFLQSAISPGDTVVDATLGNGYDCQMLAECVGDSGRVIGFDVQQQAIDSTRERLGPLAKQCELILAGHETLADHCPQGLSAVVFNLGYLPGADKAMTTQAAKTLCALAAAVQLLRQGGLLSVMCYIGHPGGMEEGRAVREWASLLPRSDWRVFHYQAVNAPNDPPFLIIVEKL